MASKEQKIIDIAVKRLKIAIDADEHNRTAGIDDLKFVNGEQWDPAEKKRRATRGRPALQINLLPKFVDQVVGEMLHNETAIKIKPSDSTSDKNIAIIRQGIIANIEYNSNAKGIYSYAGKQQVSSGYGAWRVLTRYCEDNPFLQEIYLEGIRNPFLVYMDPSAKDQNYADAKWGFLLEKVPVDEFKERYPDASAAPELEMGHGTDLEHWYDEDTVTVAEYFTVEKQKVLMHQLDDGSVVTDEEWKDVKEDWEEDYQETLDEIAKGPSQEAPEEGEMAEMPGQEAMGMPPQPPTMPQMAPQKELKPQPKIVKSRETEKTVIKHRVITGGEIIEGGIDGEVVAGKYIPLVLLKGKELNIEGKNYVYSLVRHGKDPQKLVNYWNSSAAETIALAPKAPWIGTAKQFEGYENDYAAANVENFPFLKYNADPEAPGPPQRMGASNPPVAIFEQIRRGEENLKSVLGMFNADVGGPQSQQTGLAMQAAQRPGDISTYEFMENLSRARLYTGRIINEMIPYIYDSERDVRVRNMDESESFVPINTTVGSAMKAVTEKPEQYGGIDHKELRTLFSKNGKEAKYNDITAGKYDVVTVTGPSYATQRQEASQNLMGLVQAMPQQMSVAADLIVENMDFKGADELANRLRKPLVAQGITEPREGEKPPAPQPPGPEVLLAQAKLESEKLKVQAAQLKLQSEQITMQKEAQTPPEASGVNPMIEMMDAKLAEMKLQTEQLRLQTEQNRMQMEQKKAAMQLELERERLNMELQKMQMEIQFQREAHMMKMKEIDNTQNDNTSEQTNINQS
jgi:hypothetical protein